MIKIIKQMMIIETLLTTTFLILLAMAAYQDIREKRIPDEITGGVLAVGVLEMLLLEAPGAVQRVAGMVTVSFLMLFVSLFSGGGFGGGDIKLMAACGLVLGAEEIFYSFFYALVLGGIYGVLIISCKNKSKKEEIAFGPFLVSGILIRLIFHVF